MFGELALLMSASPISSQSETNRPRNTSSATGSRGPSPLGCAAPPLGRPRPWVGRRTGRRDLAPAPVTRARSALRRASQDAHARYEAGAATQLEVITADRDLLQAEEARIAAIADLRIARQTLRIRAGMDVE